MTSGVAGASKINNVSDMNRSMSSTSQIGMGGKSTPQASMATIGFGLNINKKAENVYDPSTDTALQSTIGQTRDLAEQLAAKRNASRRGGGRQLLSDSRSTTLG
jgi:hypothetical protein